MSPGELLDVFGNATDFAEAAESARAMLSAKVVRAVAKDPRLERGLTKLLTASPDEQPETRLARIALFGRLSAAAGIRPNQPAYRRIATALEVPLEPLSLLADAEDRLYVTTAVREIRPPWAVSWLARVAVDDEADTVREEAIAAIVERAPALDAAVRTLVEALGSWNPGTENPTSSRAKRVRRIVEDLGESADLTSDVGDAIGAEISSLIRRPSTGDGDLSPKVAEELADATMRLLRRVIRVKLSGATDPRTYEPLRTLRAWLTPVGWARLVDKVPSAALLERDLIEAIALLARQGVIDDAMLDRLEELSGRGRVEQHRAALSRRAGLRPDIADALAGRTRKRAESDDLRIGTAGDEAAELAEILIEAESLLAALDARHKSGRETDAMEAAAGQLAQDLVRLARRRGFEVRGAPGDRMEYSAEDHVQEQGVPRSRWVELAEPVVIRVRPDGSISVVRKAKVVPAAGP